MQNETKPDAPSATADERTFAQRVEAIVDDGREVRANTAAAVRETLGIVDKANESLSEIFDLVVVEALEAATKEIDGPGSDSVLREVMDGLGDGFESAAQAVELAVAEAQTNARQFAEEDLHAAAADLRSIRGLLVETASRTAQRLKGCAHESASSLIEHAERTAQRVYPSLESAASAAMGNVKGLAKQAAGAGVSATRQGIGALFTEIGARLQNKGD